jgi:hypothetical protein
MQVAFCFSFFFNLNKLFLVLYNLIKHVLRNIQCRFLLAFKIKSTQLINFENTYYKLEK